MKQEEAQASACNWALSWLDLFPRTVNHLPPPNSYISIVLLLKCHGSGLIVSRGLFCFHSYLGEGFVWEKLSHTQSMAPSSWVCARWRDEASHTHNWVFGLRRPIPSLSLSHPTSKVIATTQCLAQHPPPPPSSSSHIPIQCQGPLIFWTKNHGYVMPWG